MKLRKTPAIATLKQFGLKQFGLRIPQIVGDKEPNLVVQALMDKDYSPQSIKELARRNILGTAFAGLVLRDAGLLDSPIINFFAQVKLPGRVGKTYKGTPEENKAVDFAASSGFGNTKDNRMGVGIARNYSSPSLPLPDEIRKTPILIVGYGAAGILAHSQLRTLGFTSISVLEKSDVSFGIWGREDVYRGSRNNPFSINLQGARFLVQAPGEGNEVRVALSNRQLGLTEKVAVINITPGQLSHKVDTTNSVGKTYPIVINCVGLGKPVPLSDSSRMKTETSSTDAKAVRWQKIHKQEDMRGKMFILIGLGNSTAEMLRQIHQAQDSGVEVDYRVFTHYSYDSIMNPDEFVPLSKRQARQNERNEISREGYRVFRDLSASNLTSYQGDLPLSRYDYYRALNTQRILSDIHSWEVVDRTIVYDRRQKRHILTFDHLYHLTGYHHTQESLKPYGCAWDRKQAGPKYDYDGELQDAGGRRFKGYFGFGAVLEAEWNRNATVIPGMIYRIGDLLFSIIMRATEYSLTIK